jgi:hypothetical protein
MIDQLIAEMYMAETGRSVVVNYDEGKVYYDEDYVTWLRNKIAIQMITPVVAPPESTSS